ncbi:hypothetical protein ACIRG4_17135 [Streptomyces sp. NPDC102395]
MYHVLEERLARDLEGLRAEQAIPAQHHREHAVRELRDVLAV